MTPPSFAKLALYLSISAIATGAVVWNLDFNKADDSFIHRGNNDTLLEDSVSLVPANSNQSFSNNDTNSISNRLISQNHGSATNAQSSIVHTLPEQDPKSRQIRLDSKQVDGQTDYIYRDALNREALFRGWNVSGSVKLAYTGFKPFLSTEDAKQSFSIMRQNMGANQVRFTISWEGVHPAPDVIDYAYLDDVVAQMKEAMNQGMHVVVDYHSDLYSRHLFTTTSANTGNGAPAWIIEGGNHGTDDCGIPCVFTWGAHKLSNSAVRSAMRAFWLNAPIDTPKGTRYVQTEFLWQLGKVSQYLTDNLDATQRDYLLGIEPLNEPFDGGIKELGLKDYAEFDNLILWPFYERVRTTMDTYGLNDKWVFAEPMVFWNTNTGAFAPTTGWSYLKNPPQGGYVFSPHFYDQARMGVNEFREVNNASYFAPFAITRHESRYLKMPLFLGEYGMWNTGTGRQDTVRMVEGVIQSMQNAHDDVTYPFNATNTPKSRYTSFYSPFISGTQWQWDYYYDQHDEQQNGNPDLIKTEDDGWNGENFSVINNNATGYNHDAKFIERVYPRRTQGDLLHFAYNSMAQDKTGQPIDWLSLRVSIPDEFLQREFLRGERFALLSWQGRQSDAPTELYIPSSFDVDNMVIITEKVIQNDVQISPSPNHHANEILLTKDYVDNNASINTENLGYRLAVWDDPDLYETDLTPHFVLIIEDNGTLSQADYEQLQRGLIHRIQQQRQSPIYLTSITTDKEFEPDLKNQDAFMLKHTNNKQCMDVQAGGRYAGTPVQWYDCNGSAAQRWYYRNSMLVSALDDTLCLSASSKLVSKASLSLQTCNHLAGQKFERRANWQWHLASDPSLKIDASPKWGLTPIRLTKATQSDTKHGWQVIY